MNRGGDIPEGQIELDGVRFWCAPIKEIRFEGPGETVIVFEGFDIVDKCDHCRRFDTRPRMASSWESAIEQGWVRRVCPHKDISTSEDRAADTMVLSFFCGATTILGGLRGRNPRLVVVDGVYVPHDCRLEQIPTKVT